MLEGFEFGLGFSFAVLLVCVIIMNLVNLTDSEYDDPYDYYDNEGEDDNG